MKGVRQWINRTSGLTSLVALVIATGGCASSPSDLKSAAPVSSGTYILRDFAVGPAVDPRTNDAKDEVAQVAFSIAWSSGTYPGVHNCTIRVHDASDAIIGSNTDEVIALSESRAHLQMPVSGSIEGATATGSCDTQRLDTPAPLVARDTQVEVVSEYGMEALVQVTFEASWPRLAEGERPGSNACQAALFSDEGQLIDKLNFTATVGIGSQVEVDFPKVQAERSRGTLSVNVACIPFTSEDQFPDATSQA